MSWTFTTLEHDGTEAVSSSTTYNRALAFACAHLRDGIRVLRLQSTDGELVTEEEIKERCAEIGRA